MVRDLVVPDWGAVSVPGVESGPPAAPASRRPGRCCATVAATERQPAPGIATQTTAPPRRDAEFQAEPSVRNRAVGTGQDRCGLNLPTGIIPADVVRATADSPGVLPSVLASRMTRTADPPASATQIYHLEILLSVAAAARRDHVIGFLNRLEQAQGRVNTSAADRELVTNQERQLQDQVANWDLPRELLLRPPAASPPDDDDDDHVIISSESSEDDRGIDF